MISRASTRLLTGALTLGVMVVATRGAAAQSPATAAASRAAPSLLPLKRALLPTALLPACPVVRSPAFAPNEAQRQQARDLTARSQQDAILGDSAAALTHLRDARRLNPTDPDLAYQLARSYENAAASDSAVAEYCRFLTLSPRSSDAQDARDRITVLAKPRVDPGIEMVNALLRQGVAAYDAGRMPEAEAQFTRVLETQPAWADVYYDRALARLAQNDRDGAAGDFELYLRVKPNADDRQTVAAQLPVLRRAKYSAGGALALGIIPGGGQFYTNRPVWGTLLLLASGGAIAASFIPQTKIEDTRQQGTDPFGNGYTFTARRRVADHPAFVPAMAAYGVLTIVGATEAYAYAKRMNASPPRRVSMFVVPSTQPALGITISF